ncbi:MAG: hybrid sensor histidine kinase/response regulator [Desulfuromonadaceae bacterium]|nr:hybrid sensor histidine kinase/response regulator [Desulfuromonadaceae bacterium]MDD2854959.1 hybrid sensor histidine kinase/response regulator [Desulfuromonadaceae bacterium]
MAAAHYNNGHSLQEPETTILVVDDDRVIRELCQRALGNYRVLEATDCEAALRMYELENIDLILSDIMMPGDSGIELLKQIKILDPNAIVIMMTGFSDRDVILTALKEDADDFINKPLNILQLRASIEKSLEKKALKEELAHLKRSDQIKNEFLSLVSHKLRTPITGISLFLQNLALGIFNPEDTYFAESLDMATEEAEYLGQLVTDLLAFSQIIIEGGKRLNKSRCDLNEIIAQTLIKCRNEHCKFNIDIETAPSKLPELELDAVRIRFALYQIIDNAFKFAGEHGHVTLKMGSHENYAFIVISDSGIGIPESELPKVFEKFYQIDPDGTGQVRGFGLGLFYARNFVRLHGGTITLDSEPGLGTTVTIRLPINVKE